MKTAIELAFARIELMKDINPDSIHWQMFKDNYIKKEKEQIINTFKHAQVLHAMNDQIRGEQYYNQTYKNNNNG